MMPHNILLALLLAAVWDPSWIRDFAVPATPEALASDEAGQQNKLNWDPRFRAVLQQALPQHQSFWFDHGRFTPVPDLAQEFMGVPGSVLLDANRYITVNGCVPHDCADRGLVWIDTASRQKPMLIFAATGNVSNSPTDRNSQIHLWLFASMPTNATGLPQPFSSSLTRWWNKTTQVWNKYSPEKIVLVTLVQPSGQTRDLSPALFSFSQPVAPPKS